MAQDVSTSQLNHCLWTDEAIKHVGLASDKICVTGYFDRAAVETRIRERELENERLRALNEQLRRLMNALNECEARLVARQTDQSGY
jgi:hypothetical protein